MVVVVVVAVVVVVLALALAPAPAPAVAVVVVAVAAAVVVAASRTCYTTARAPSGQKGQCHPKPVQGYVQFRQQLSAAAAGRLAGCRDKKCDIDFSSRDPL